MLEQGIRLTKTSKGLYVEGRRVLVPKHFERMCELFERRAPSMAQCGMRHRSEEKLVFLHLVKKEDVHDEMSEAKILLGGNRRAHFIREEEKWK